jgi:hypothetical protein
MVSVRENHIVSVRVRGPLVGVEKYYRGSTMIGRPFVLPVESVEKYYQGSTAIGRPFMLPVERTIERLFLLPD